MKESLKKKMRTKAEENTSISVGTRKESTDIKKGNPLDHTVKHLPYAGSTFGMSKGITKNMDNYESLRVDVWLSDEVQNGETLEQAMARVSDVLDEQLEKAVMSVIGE